MKRHYKSYVFNDMDLYSDGGGLDADDMALFFKQLPQDAKIVRWGHYVERAQVFFIVEHDLFEPIDDSAQIPEVFIDFDKLWEKDKNERSYYNPYIYDMKIWSSSNYITNDTVKKMYEAGTQDHLLDSFQYYTFPTPKLDDKWNMNWVDTGETSGKILVTGDSGPKWAFPLVGVDVAQKEVNKDANEIINKSPCDHEWATYDSGFTEKFDYCKICDQKRDIKR